MENRIEKLEKQMEEVITRFNDIQDGHKSLFKRVDAYHDDKQKQVRDELDNLNEHVSESLRDVYKAIDTMKQEFGGRVKQEIAKITADEIASALAKKVILTRQASREEIKAGAAIAVRQLTSAEIR